MSTQSDTRTPAQRHYDDVMALEEQITDLMDNIGYAELGTHPAGPDYQNTCRALGRVIEPLQEAVRLLEAVRHAEARRLPFHYAVKVES